MAHRIAVFNHSPNVLLLIESVLRQKGFEVFTFLETLTDISKVVALTPDLVIIGHVRGFSADELEIVHEFRSNPETADVPIVVCTTGAAQVQQSGGLNTVPYVSIVPKPFNIHELIDAVNLALGVGVPSAKTAGEASAHPDSPSIL